MTSKLNRRGIRGNYDRSDVNMNVVILGHSLPLSTLIALVDLEVVCVWQCAKILKNMHYLFKLHNILRR